MDTIAAVRSFVELPLAAAANGMHPLGTWRANGAWGSAVDVRRSERVLTK